MELTLNHVTKVIRGVTIIDDVSAQWHGGAVYGLRGYNGSGKTMLMRLASGLIFPTKGTVEVDGVVLGKEFEFPQSMGILIENPGFLDSFTGLQNLTLLSEINQVATQEEIRQALATVGLDPDDKRKFKKYSLGMKQRLGIAAAIMEHPDLLILDEPTNALDADGVEMVISLVRREKERGALVILSCHENEYLEQMADTIYTIEHGRFVKEVHCSSEPSAGEEAEG